MSEATMQHLNSLRGMEIRLAKDPAKKTALEKIRTEIHRIEKEYQLPLSKFSVGGPSADPQNHRRPNFQEFSQRSDPNDAQADSSSTKKPEPKPNHDPQKEEPRATNTGANESEKKKTTNDSTQDPKSAEPKETAGSTESQANDAYARSRAQRAYQENATATKARRVTGYDQFGRPEYEYDCQSSFSLFL